MQNRVSPRLNNFGGYRAAVRTIDYNINTGFTYYSRFHADIFNRITQLGFLLHAQQLIIR